MDAKEQDMFLLEFFSQLKSECVQELFSSLHLSLMYNLWSPSQCPPSLFNFAALSHCFYLYPHGRMIVFEVKLTGLTTKMNFTARRAHACAQSKVHRNFKHESLFSLSIWNADVDPCQELVKKKEEVKIIDISRTTKSSLTWLDFFGSQFPNRFTTFYLTFRTSHTIHFFKMNLQECVHHCDALLYMAHIQAQHIVWNVLREKYGGNMITHTHIFDHVWGVKMSTLFPTLDPSTMINGDSCSPGVVLRFPATSSSILMPA